MSSERPPVLDDLIALDEKLSGELVELEWAKKQFFKLRDRARKEPSEAVDSVVESIKSKIHQLKIAVLYASVAKTLKDILGWLNSPSDFMSGMSIVDAKKNVQASVVNIKKLKDLGYNVDDLVMSVFEVKKRIKEKFPRQREDQRSKENHGKRFDQLSGGSKKLSEEDRLVREFFCRLSVAKETPNLWTVTYSQDVRLAARLIARYGADFVRTAMGWCIDKGSSNMLDFSRKIQAYVIFKKHEEKWQQWKHEYIQIASKGFAPSDGITPLPEHLYCHFACLFSGKYSCKFVPLKDRESELEHVKELLNAFNGSYFVVSKFMAWCFQHHLGKDNRPVTIKFLRYFVVAFKTSDAWKSMRVADHRKLELTEDAYGRLAWAEVVLLKARWASGCVDTAEEEALYAALQDRSIMDNLEPSLRVFAQTILDKRKSPQSQLA